MMRHVDTMKRFADGKKILQAVLCILGVSMAGTGVSGLLRYHEAAARYIERVDPLVDRLVHPQLQQSIHRDELIGLLLRSLPADEFNANIGLINRALQPNHVSMETEERIELWSELHTLRFRMQSLETPGIFGYQTWILTGVSLLFFGLLLDLKPKPRHQPPQSPIQAWESVPAPTLAKNATTPDRIQPGKTSLFITDQ